MKGTGFKRWLGQLDSCNFDVTPKGLMARAAASGYQSPSSSFVAQGASQVLSYFDN
jgi:hypothetical protein